jgi:hypothetical protein
VNITYKEGERPYEMTNVPTSSPTRNSFVREGIPEEITDDANVLPAVVQPHNIVKISFFLYGHYIGRELVQSAHDAMER